MGGHPHARLAAVRISRVAGLTPLERPKEDLLAAPEGFTPPEGAEC